MGTREERILNHLMAGRDCDDASNRSAICHMTSTELGMIWWSFSKRPSAEGVSPSRLLTTPRLSAVGFVASIRATSRSVAGATGEETSRATGGRARRGVTSQKRPLDGWQAKSGRFQDGWQAKSGRWIETGYYAQIASKQSASAPIASWYMLRACSRSPRMNMQLPLFTSALAL